MTAGVRYTAEHKTLNTLNTSLVYNPGAANNGATNPPSNGVVFPFIADLSKDANAVTPKFSVNWQATPDAMVYVSAARGYKSGGYSNTARLVLGAGFGPEYIWSYEAGAKTDWFDHRLRVDVAGFKYDWTGLQFSSTIAPQVSVISNAGVAALTGFGANVTAKPTDGLTLTLDATLLSSRYTNFANYALPSGLRQFVGNDKAYNSTTQIYNATGKQLTNAPPVSVIVTAQKDFELDTGADLYVRGEYIYNARTYFDPSNVAIASRPNYTLLNASIGYSPPHSHWTVALWGKNMADSMYVNGGNYGGSITAPVGDPRTFGVRVNYTY